MFKTTWCLQGNNKFMTGKNSWRYFADTLNALRLNNMYYNINASAQHLCHFLIKKFKHSIQFKNLLTLRKNL